MDKDFSIKPYNKRALLSNNDLIIQLTKQNEFEALEKLLSEKGMELNINFIDPILQFSALHFAASLGLKKMVKLLIFYQADVGLANNENITPLHLAIENGKSSIIYKILHPDINLNKSDQSGLTPLHISALKGIIEPFNIIFKFKDKLNFSNDLQYGFNPLHFAVIGRSEHIIKNIADFRPELMNKVSNSGETPLYLAIRNNDHESTAFLIDAGSKSTNSHHIISQALEYCVRFNSDPDIFSLIAICNLSQVKDHDQWSESIKQIKLLSQGKYQLKDLVQSLVEINDNSTPKKHNYLNLGLMMKSSKKIDLKNLRSKICAEITQGAKSNRDQSCSAEILANIVISNIILQSLLRGEASKIFKTNDADLDLLTSKVLKPLEMELGEDSIKIKKFLQSYLVNKTPSTNVQRPSSENSYFNYLSL